MTYIGKVALGDARGAPFGHFWDLLGLAWPDLRLPRVALAPHPKCCEIETLIPQINIAEIQYMLINIFDPQSFKHVNILASKPSIS